MKNSYLKFRLLKAAAARLLPLLLLVCWMPAAVGQNLRVSLSETNNALNNCNARSLTALVSGGSGSYAYFWSSSPSSHVHLGNGPSITVSPSMGTTYTVAVEDQVSGQYVQKSVLVSPLLSGAFQLFIPNAFFEGQHWRVLDDDSGAGPLNAFEYQLTIKDDWGNYVFSSSGTVSSGVTGLVGGAIRWNGRLNGSGSYVPSGNYFYDLRLINCSVNQLIRGTITYFRPAELVMKAYPHPASTEVNLLLTTSTGSMEENEPITQLPAPALVELVSPAGEVVLSQTLQAFPARIGLETIPEEMYSLRVRCGAWSFSSRFMIQR